ncbi:MAG: AMP-binding protein [Desulfobacterota bacterium]|nr:AMP-binding protein [Thermodesulfobacteriota bacterium]MDW8002369.1 AMP-binding protein [Deltaproteobacteria bacterium]
MSKKDFFDEFEIMDRKERESYQLQKLREHIKRAYERAIAIKELFDAKGIKPEDVNDFDDLEKLPIIRKADVIELQKRYPPYGGLLTVPEEEIERVFITPGPIYLPHQVEEISWFGKSFFAAGFGKKDVVINTPTYHMSPAGILFHEGIRAVGATVIPTGVGNTDSQIKTMLDLKVTGYAGMPSFLMTIIKRAEEMGYDFKKDFSLKKAWFTGEMLPSSMRKVFEEDYGIDTYQCYSVTELGGCVAYECKEKKGMHFMDDYVIEIVDPESGKRVKEGEIGELVATPIHNPCWGLVRFGTGDMTSYISEPCPCGRTSYRITGIVGRSTDAVKVRGMFVVKKQMESFFGSISEISKYQVIVDRKGERDEIHLKAELKEGITDKEVLRRRIDEEFPKNLRVRLDSIEFCDPGTIKEEETLIDKRKWD